MNVSTELMYKRVLVLMHLPNPTVEQVGEAVDLCARIEALGGISPITRVEA